MNQRVVLGLGFGFFVAGLTALGVAVTVSKSPPPPPAQPAPASAPAQPAPPVPTTEIPPPPPDSAPPAPQGSRPMRPELGMSLSESSLLNGPIDIGPSSIGIAERAPKVAGLVGGSPCAKGGIRPGDRLYSVDGRSVESVADFEAALQKKTIPGEVVFRVGPTRAESRDVRIVFK